MAQEISAALSSAGLPIERPAEMDADRILEVMRADKKKLAGAVRYALPSDIGQMAASNSGWTVSVSDAIVREVLT
jgi:3-dehydroquinate synthetase